MSVHPETPMGEPLPSVTTGPTSVWVGPPAWAGSLTASAPVTGYGPTADAIRAEVDADDAKDALIAQLRSELAEVRADLSHTMAVDAALQRQLDARNRQLAELQTPEAAGIIADRANARAVVTEMIGRFGATRGSDWVACTTAGQLARWSKRAGLEQP